MAASCSGKANFVFHITLLILMFLIRLGWGRVHKIQLKDEVRQTIELSKFGFLQKGNLTVKFSNLTIEDITQSSKVQFGFTLEKTGSDGISPYMEQHSERCILKDQSQVRSNGNQISLAIIKFVLTDQSHIEIDKYGSDFLHLTIEDMGRLYTTVATATSSPVSSGTHIKNKSQTTIRTPASSTLSAVTNKSQKIPSAASMSVSTLTSPSPQSNSTVTSPSRNSADHSKQFPPGEGENITRKRREAETTRATLVKGPFQRLPLYKSEKTYSGNFVVQIKSKAEEGLYNLYFHNCPLSNKPRVPVAIQIYIEEKNEKNFLSAGEEPLPYMFGVLSALFFGTAIFWLQILRKNREFTYKVHYMMFVLILLKALDLMFQAVNYHFISKDGKPAESWEVLYYITHLLKGALLFATIVLIGTGFFFIKHVLSDRDKKIFMIVIPLQILANTAQIVMESTEEANTQYTTWKELFILVDLLCCGAILFPVVWSIRHLQEGSQTDGKAALNLAKLKLFRHFYVMIVCYIYFTRIIVYLVKITVPFQFMWLDDFFSNAASYVFFVLTGYKFRPAPDNPYLHVPQGDSDDEMEMEEVVTNAGLTEGVTRLQPSSDGKRIFETA
ncbi:protein GPR107-like [Porites lutea]|uniref:protein GPR107-like n=1 Tax=Porites lutea TaxID=51062 RepID=UPI003CC52B74